VEADDLDFKLRYDKTESAEIAKDVAAFANHVGGVIVLGIADSKGTASKLIPRSDFDDALRRRIRSVLASRVHPWPNIDFLSVPSTTEPDKSYLLVMVPRSALAPHAVSDPALPGLRYWTRNGSQAISLAETQVADRYHDRFSMVAGRIGRLDQLMREAHVATNHAWVVVGSVPEQSGEMLLDADIVSQLTTWANDAEPLCPGGQPAFVKPSRSSVGVRRLYLGAPLIGGAGLGVGELHTDGSTFFGHYLLHARMDDDPSYVYDHAVVEFVAAGLRLAALHATANTRTWGAGLVEAQIVPVQQGVPLPRTMRLMQDWAGRGPQQASGTRDCTSVPPSRHTVDLSALAEDNREWLIATRMVASDLLQAFRLPEVLQITTTGALRSAYLGHRTGPLCEVGRRSRHRSR
jgi:hypothetical protein